MRIVVISDSHGNKKGIDKIFKTQNFDYLFFLGDGLIDLGSYIYLDNVFAVSGNCDFFSSIENEKVVVLENKKIFYTHGNKYGVKSSLDNLINEGKEVGADFVLFGHTHKKIAIEQDGVLIINPGSFHKSADGISRGLILNIDEKVSIESLEIK